MRIFAAVRHSADPSRFYGGLWSSNFYPALRRIGHGIVESQVDLLPASRFMHVAGNFTPEETQVRATITGEILAEVRAAHEKEGVDLFLCYFYNSHFDPTGFDELRRLGIPSINFYCNSLYQFDYVAAIAAAVDFSWHAEKDARDRYLAVGARPIWVQMAADPEIYRPMPEVTRKPSACFVGQRYADRDRWMTELVRAGVPVEIYGPGWTNQTANHVTTGETQREAEYLGRIQHQPGTKRSYLEAVRRLIADNGVVPGIVRALRQVRYRNESRRLLPLFAPHAHGSIPFQRIAEVFAAHDVCLNFSNVWADSRPASGLVPHVRLRDFEGPMCRTCYLTGHTEEITEFYETGKEIDTYRSPEELIDKTRFYLGDPEAAERLRDAGYKRARHDHTWEQRFRQLFAAVGLKAASETTPA